MKLLSDKSIEDIRKSERNAMIQSIQNLTKRIPKNGDALGKIIAEQLERAQRRIDQWRDYVQSAEDIDNPDRQALMEYYKDFIDDYQLHATRQSRTLKAISGEFHIYNEDGSINEQETRKFMDPQGHPHKWFRDFMTFVMDSKFWGWEAIQLGDVVDDMFKWVEKIPEENQVPYYDAMVKDANMSYLPDSDATIEFSDPRYDTWVVRYGSKTDLGLINKCAPYIIWKQVFGSWSQHASVFGMPLRHMKTNLADNERRQNAIEALENQTGAAYIISDLMDEFEMFEQKGGGDPHNIYGEFIDKCDSAISKIVLSQTGTTDEKAYSGSAQVHERTEDSIIFSDKLDIKNVVNDMLIPRMKKIGMISTGSKIYGGWDYSEKMNIEQWSDIILKLSQAGYVVPAEEVTKKTGVEVDKQVVAMPENKNFSIMNKINKLYGKNN
jgi:phage gp29-like protein